MRKVGRVARWLWRGGRRVADLVPLTALGVLVAGSAAVALWLFAYQRLDLVLLVVGYGAAGLTALCLVAVVITTVALKLAIRRRPGPEASLVLETGRPFPTGFSLSSLGWLPFVHVRWGWEAPEKATVRLERRRGRLHELVIRAERGELRGIRRRIVVEDVFGLARLALRNGEDRSLEVRPDVGALRRMPLLTSFAGGDEIPHPMGLEDGDRTELRRYAPGDPARFIHWKVFGRTRKLVVRVPERALSKARRVVAYLVAGAEDDASAAAARVAVETGGLGGEWIFSADGADGVDARSPAEALALIVRSIDARARGGEALEAFLKRAEASGPATAIIFAPHRRGPWLDRVVAAARARRGRMRVVVGVDGLGRAHRRPFWKRALAVEPPRPDFTSLDALEDVLRVLGGARCDVIVVDRRTGRRLSDGHWVATAERGPQEGGPRGGGGGSGASARHKGPVRARPVGEHAA